VAAAAAARAAPFVDFLRDAPLDEATGEPKGPRPSVYEPAPGGLPGVRARVEALVAAAAAAPGARGAPPDLVLFSDAVDHLARLSRVLTLERGSALLVGVGGSGKRSLARLAAHLAGAACFSIAPAKGYGVPALLEDLKGLYKQAALKAQPVCLLLADSDVKEESFLEYVNQVLMTGEVAGLFPRDELEAVLGDVRPIMRAQAPGERVGRERERERVAPTRAAAHAAMHALGR
jgi:dynein heavy chain